MVGRLARYLCLFLVVSAPSALLAQQQESAKSGLVFVSDTQAPMLLEKIYRPPHHNTLATKLLFGAIDKRMPEAVFILGDVVSIGHNAHKWIEMDKYLKALRAKDIPVYALLGNHDLMGGTLRGERLFNIRFPDHISTGYYKVVDSIAVIMLNSNFSKLPAADQATQRKFYLEALHTIDADPAILCAIVACHHAPYSNSSTVGSSEAVQQQFVPAYLQSKKARLFITGHAHRFGRFVVNGKEFLTIGGGGGLHQPSTHKPIETNVAGSYDPDFHYLDIVRHGRTLQVTSVKLVPDLTHMETGYEFWVSCSE